MLISALYHRPGMRLDIALTGSKAKRAIKKVQRDLKTRSENGQPFFTKDAIRDVRDQLNRSTEKGQIITVMGLDDVPVKFTLFTGDSLSRSVDDDSEDEDDEDDDEDGEKQDLKHVVYGTLQYLLLINHSLARVRTNPCIRYLTLQTLMEYPQPIIDRHRAYCNMQIVHNSVLKNVQTGKILDGSDAPTLSKRDAKNSSKRLFAHGRMANNADLSWPS